MSAPERRFTAVRGEFTELVRLVSMVRTCIACPSQWEGLTADGRQWYGRYRGSHGSLQVGALGDTSEFAGCGGDYVMRFRREEQGKQAGWDGDMSNAEFYALAASFVTWECPSPPEPTFDANFDLLDLTPGTPSA